MKNLFEKTFFHVSDINMVNAKIHDACVHKLIDCGFFLK